MTAYEKLQRTLKRRPRKWLVTGAAGFIGSHLVETLLRRNQRVAGMDNFATGHAANLDDVENFPLDAFASIDVDSPPLLGAANPETSPDSFDLVKRASLALAVAQRLARFV